MADVLSKFRNEVFNMFLFEYDEELHLKSTYEEGREEGELIGRKEGKLIGQKEGELIGHQTLLIKLLESKGILLLKIQFYPNRMQKNLPNGLTRH